MSLSRDDALARLHALAGMQDPDPAARAEAVTLVALRNLPTGLFTTVPPDTWPAFFWHDADEVACARVIEQLDAGPYSAVGTALLALAFVGGDSVAASFRAWEETPPPWRGALYVGPDVYALQAGWELTPTGYRELVFDTAVLTRPASGAVQLSATAIGGMRDDACPRCDAQLANALALDLTDTRFSMLGMEGYVRIPVCPWCVVFQDTTPDGLHDWVRFDLDGHAVLDINGSSDIDRDGYQESYERIWVPADPPLHDESVSIWRASAEIAEYPLIGGQPAWLNDAAYATCPDCGLRMRHLAWIPLTALSTEGGDGILYVQVCARCRIAAVVHQQT